jgi:hypothetical protein
VTALLVGLLLAAPERAGEELRALRAFAEEAPAEPEPPPGLRAPPESERHARAREAYARAMADWARAHDEHLERLVERCTAFLARNGEDHRPAVLRIRAAAAQALRRWAAARADWEAVLALGEDLGPARAMLVEACRREGDYAAALRHGGPDPDLLEEAGRVERAIAAAERAGLSEKAAAWRGIGKPFPASGKIPQFSGPMVIEAGRELDPVTKKSLQDAFVGEIRICSFSGVQAAIYLVDSKGTVRAVNPRPETLHHRIEQLLARQ